MPAIFNIEFLTSKYYIMAYVALTDNSGRWFDVAAAWISKQGLEPHADFTAEFNSLEIL